MMVSGAFCFQLSLCSFAISFPPHIISFAISFSPAIHSPFYSPPGDDFIMLVMQVLSVDHLLLSSNRRYTYEQTQQDTWTRTEVNP